MTRTAHVQAFAKLNLSLAVLGRRPDGYHEIDSVVQTVDLADELEIDVESGRGIAVTNTLCDIQGPDLAERAAGTLLASKRIERRIEIRIVKRIPAGAGLGGGSADAAAVLRALDDLTLPRLLPAELEAIAAGIGSDVPLFLVGGRVRISGRGEIVTRLPASPSQVFVIVTPPVHCATADVYAAWAAHCGETPASGAALGRNDLLLPALHVRPELRRYYEAVTCRGALYAGMSGSGSSFYATFGDGVQAAHCARALRDALPECAVYECRPTDVGAVRQGEEKE